MSVKLMFVFFFVATIYFVQFAYALPRETGVGNAETAKIEDLSRKVKDIPYQTGFETGLAGRVRCSHEEATEDSKCQEHCLPKGYSYGICVSGTCSCI